MPVQVDLAEATVRVPAPLPQHGRRATATPRPPVLQRRERLDPRAAAA
ncbi:hypothetical protein [Kocuria turfanensis]